MRSYPRIAQAFLELMYEVFRLCYFDLVALILPLIILVNLMLIIYALL